MAPFVTMGPASSLPAHQLLPSPHLSARTPTRLLDDGTLVIATGHLHLPSLSPVTPSQARFPFLITAPIIHLSSSNTPQYRSYTHRLHTTFTHDSHHADLRQDP